MADPILDTVPVPTRSAPPRSDGSFPVPAAPAAEGGGYGPGVTYGTGARGNHLTDAQLSDVSAPFQGLLFRPGASPEEAANALLNGLGESIKAAANNAAKLSANGEEVRAQNVIRAVQAMTKMMEQIQALFLDIKILPFKLAGAFARGIGLTAL